MPDDGPIQFVKPENPPDLSSLVRPGVGIVFSGSPRDTVIFQDPPVPAVRSSSDATGRILSLLSSTFAKLSILVRSCIGDAREMQDRFREKNKIPKSAKIQYQPAPVSDVVQAIMLQCVATIGALFGNAPSSYALDKFAKAISTGDMRAFKIRLMFLKVRDSLKGSAMYNDFVEGLEDAISESESMAGCKPDPSPRRLSKAEQERKRRIRERLEAKKKIQPELPLVWPSEQDKEEHQQQQPIPSHDDINNEQLSTGYEQPVDNSVNAGEDGDTNAPSKASDFQYIEKCTHGRNYQPTLNGKNEDNIPKVDDADLTVKKSPECVFYSKRSPQGTDGPIRKARDYNTVEQILDDIESGAITRYETVDEISEDLNAGLLTPVEALMFTAALDRYVESDHDPEYYATDDDPVKDLDLDVDPEDQDGENCDDEEDGDWDYEPAPRERRRSTFSYNPIGFCGVDWGKDDEW